MRAVAVAFGVLASLVVAVIVAFTLGELAGVAVFLGLLGGTSYTAAAGGPRSLRRFAVGSASIVVVGGALVAWQAALLTYALTGTEGPADPPDPSALAAAHDKLLLASAAGSFRLELAETEVEAVIQASLSEESPLARVRATIVDGRDGEAGTLHIEGDFKRGSLAVVGRARVVVVGGAVELAFDAISLGVVRLPQIVRSSIAGIVSALADLNEHLAGIGVRVDGVHLGGGVLTVNGTRG